MNAPRQTYSLRRATSGFTLLEILITLIISAIGLLGLASLQMTSLNNQHEANQRTQAVLLIEDMANRIRSNATAARAGNYLTSNDYGQNVMDCSAIVDPVALDLCQWNNDLVGTDTILNGRNLGSIDGARGCIENLAGSADGEAIIRLTISWVGTSFTRPPSSACGRDDFGADNEDFRRTASVAVVLADLSL